jgi:TP901 family phage tail tape measure protein
MAVEIEVEINTKEAQQNVDSLKDIAAELSDKLEEMAEAQKEAAKNVGAATVALADAKKKTEELKQQILEETLAQKKANEERRNAVEEQKKLNNAIKEAADQERAYLDFMQTLRDDDEKQRKAAAQSVLDIIRDQQDEEKKLAQAEAQAAKDREEGAKAQASAFGKIMVGIELVKAGLSVAIDAFKAFWGAISESVKAAIEFEAALAGIKTISPNAEIKQLRKDLLDLSSAFGFDELSTAKAQYDLLSSGITDASDAALVLKNSAELATAGMDTLDSASKTVAIAINSFGLSAQDSAHITDVLAQTTEFGVLTLNELGSAFGQVAPIAASAGISIEETSAALATVTLSGKTAAESATGIKAALSALLKPSADLEAAFKKVSNESVAQSVASKGLNETLQLVRKAIGDGSAAWIKYLGGTEAATAGIVLATGKQKEFTQFTSEMSDATRKAGSVVAEMGNTVKDTAKFQIGAMTQSFENLGTEILTVFEPAIAEAARTLVGFITDVKDFVRENEAGLQKIGDAAINMVKQFGEFVKAIANSNDLKNSIYSLYETAKLMFTAFDDGFGVINKLFSSDNDGFKGAVKTLEDARPVLEGISKLLGTMASLGIDLFITFKPLRMLFSGVADGLISMQKALFGWTGLYKETTEAVKNQRFALEKEIPLFQQQTSAVKEQTKAQGFLNDAAKEFLDTQKKTTEELAKPKPKPAPVGLTSEQKKQLENDRKERQKAEYEAFIAIQEAEAFNNQQILKLEEELTDDLNKAALDRATRQVEILKEQAKAEEDVNKERGEAFKRAMEAMQNQAIADTQQKFTLFGGSQFDNPDLSAIDNWKAKVKDALDTYRRGFDEGDKVAKAANESAKQYLTGLLGFAKQVGSSIISVGEEWSKVKEAEFGASAKAAEEAAAKEVEAYNEGLDKKKEALKESIDDEIKLFEEKNEAVLEGQLERIETVRAAEIEALDVVLSDKLDALKQESDNAKTVRDKILDENIKSLSERKEKEISFLKDMQKSEIDIIKQRNDDALSIQLERISDAKNAELEAISESSKARIDALKEESNKVKTGRQKALEDQLYPIEVKKEEEITRLKEVQREELKNSKDMTLQQIADIKVRQREELRGIDEKYASELEAINTKIQEEEKASNKIFEEKKKLILREEKEASEAITRRYKHEEESSKRATEALTNQLLASLKESQEAQLKAVDEKYAKEITAIKEKANEEDKVAIKQFEAKRKILTDEEKLAKQAIDRKYKHEEEQAKKANDKIFDDYKKTLDKRLDDELSVLDKLKKVSDKNAKDDGKNADIATQKLNAVSKTADAISAIFEKIPGPVGMIGSLIAGLVSLVNQLPKIISSLPDMIEGITDSIPVLIDELGKALKDFIPWLIKDIAKRSFDFEYWLKILENLGGALVNIFEGVFDGLDEVFDFGSWGEDVWEGIKDAGNAAGEWLASLGGKIWEGLKSFGDTIGQFFKNLGGNIWEGLKSFGDTVGQFFKNLGGKIWDGLSSLGETIWEWFKGLGLRIWNGLKEAVGDVFVTFGKWGAAIWQGFVSIVKDIGLWFKEKGIAIWEGLRDAVGGAWQAVKGWGGRIWDGFREAVVSAWSWLRNIGAQIWDGLKSAMGSIGDWFTGGKSGKKGLGGVVNSIGDGIASVFGWSDGGVISGKAQVLGDSKKNDTIPAMLSPGEMVIPRSAMDRGLPGILAFARDAIGAQSSSMGMQRFSAGGLVSGSSGSMGFSLDGMIEEMQALRSDINSIGYALAKNAVLTHDILDRWDGNGLPKERDF